MKAVPLGATGKAVANVTPTATVPTCLTPAPTSVTVCIHCIVLSQHCTQRVYDSGSIIINGFGTDCSVRITRTPGGAGPPNRLTGPSNKV